MNSNGQFRQAATLILVRNTATDMEVYMTERPGTQDFPGVHVFPGGKVDDRDHQLEEICHGLNDADASRQLNLASGGLAYWVTAIRESFEEANVLLAYSDHSTMELVRDPEALDKAGDLREGSLLLGEFCEKHTLTLASNALRYFSHWITPASAPRRYDARFFVCDMPTNQSVTHDEKEVVSAEWVSPNEALARFGRKEWALIDPTLRSLEVLANYSSSDELYADIDAGKHLPYPTAELMAQGMQHVPQFVRRAHK
jgi:8-oxo-dGTP pyrophosphatase MutT (NUDIX family)